jgi:hypothetical protein
MMVVVVVMVMVMVVMVIMVMIVVVIIVMVMVMILSHHNRPVFTRGGGILLILGPQNILSVRNGV